MVQSGEETRTVTPEVVGRYTFVPLDQAVDLDFTDEEPTELGRGGLGRVLSVYDRHLGRQVALKELLLDAQAEDDGSTEKQDQTNRGVVRFLREARVTAQLEHPSIIPVYELGRRTDGTLYYTMKQVRGHTLSDELNGCASLDQRLDYLGHFVDLCQAVAYAHSRGVVHRDIKPSNVMVGEFGETVVLDWGIAKVGDQEDLRSQEIKLQIQLPLDSGEHHTIYGTAMGTPAYMSPEQAEGRIDAIDERSDVWGLGAVLYRLLTDEPPYAGKDPLEVLERVKQEPIRPVRQLCASAPRELAAVAEKSLTRDPNGRYPSARALADEVLSYQKGLRVRAYEYSSWDLLKRFARKNKTLFVSITLFLLMLVVAVILLWDAYEDESRALASEARSRELAEQAVRQANYRIAQAMNKEADKQLAQQRMFTASIYAAASLVHNPAHPKSQFHHPGFSRSHPGSTALLYEAASCMHQSRMSVVEGLQAVLRAPSGLRGGSFSPDGRHLAAGSLGQSAYIWDLTTKRIVLELSGHGGTTVTRAEFSPDDRQGLRLLTASDDASWRIWDASDGQLLFRGTGAGPLWSAAFSPDGRRAAVGGEQGNILLIDALQGKTEKNLQGHDQIVRDLAFSPDGRNLASASIDKTVRLWDLATGKGSKLAGYEMQFKSLAFAPDGRYLAAADGTGKILMWDLSIPGKVQILVAHDNMIFSLAFSPDGRLLISSASDGEVRIHTGMRQLELILPPHKQGVRDILFSPDGKLLASLSEDGSVRLWRYASGRTSVEMLLPQHVAPEDMSFSPDGSQLAAVAYRDVPVYDSLSGVRLRTLTGHGDQIFSLVYSPDGRLIATASRDRKIGVFHAATGKLLHMLAGHQDDFERDSLAFSPDSKILYSVNRDGTLRRWNPMTGTMRHEPKDCGQPLFSVDVSADEKLVAWGGLKGELHLLDAKSLQPVARLQGHSDEVGSLNFSPDRRLLASSAGNQIFLWDLGTRKRLKVLSEHTNRVNRVAFSSDGGLLASVGEDHRVIVWSVASGQPVQYVKHPFILRVLDFSPDGGRLATALGSNLVIRPLATHLPKVAPQDILTRAQQDTGLILKGFEIAEPPRPSEPREPQNGGAK